MNIEEKDKNNTCPNHNDLPVINSEESRGYIDVCLDYDTGYLCKRTASGLEPLYVCKRCRRITSELFSIQCQHYAKNKETGEVDLIVNEENCVCDICKDDYIEWATLKSTDNNEKREMNVIIKEHNPDENE
jgi:hypothetical protein